MKILLLGATGNFGSSLLPALLAHGHDVVVYVRSEQRFKDSIDSKILSKVTVEIGDATDTTAIYLALKKHRCTALVNTAGLAAIFPWQAYQLQEIIKAVAEAGVIASKELGWGIRGWFMGGMTCLDVPGTNGVPISNYFPLLIEHTATFKFLKTQPREHLQWSMLCPSVMTPNEHRGKLLEAPSGNGLSVKADEPPGWIQTWGVGVPFVGGLVGCLVNAARYETRLVDCADFVAGDLAGVGERREGREGGFVGRRVGVFDGGKKWKAE